jgi:hypothetical protein
MNVAIETQKKLKKKLGVTIHKRMSVTDIMDAWGRIPAPIKNQLPPSISAAFAIVDTTVSTANTTISLYPPAKQAYDTCALAIDAGVAILAGQPQQPTLALAQEEAKQAAVPAQAEISSLGGTLADSLISLVG